MTEILTPKIIFEDQHLVVLSKPAGLLSQGEHRGDPNLVDWLREYFERKYVGLVHRLDRNTSGLMVVAKRTKSAGRLSESLKEGKLNRGYLAFVYGSPVVEPGDNLWRHWLTKHRNNNEVQIFKKKRARAQEARMRVKVLGRGQYKSHKLTLLECKLETGRSHQIRVQSSYMGYPLLGDIKYGLQKYEGINKSFGRPALHSYKMKFPHPKTGEKMSFEDPMPEDMAKLKTTDYRP